LYQRAKLYLFFWDTPPLVQNVLRSYLRTVAADSSSDSSASVFVPRGSANPL